MQAVNFDLALWIWIGFALILYPVQLWITAPYGRHINKKWGPLMDNRVGWLIMEIVSPLVFGFFFLIGEAPKPVASWVFFFLWISHYGYRSLIYPFRTRTTGKKIPVSIVLFAMLFNVVNGFFNGYYLGSLAGNQYLHWVSTWQFWLGLLIFLLGWWINFQSDEILLKLRKPGEKGYKIPNGGLFSQISCPNHFGEMVEWLGFAVMCWSLPALSFAIWTIANLLPRALSHHRWYRHHFKEYPPKRKAVIPSIL